MGAFHVDAWGDAGGVDGVAVEEKACKDAAWLLGSGEAAASVVEEDVGDTDRALAFCPVGQGCGDMS